MMSQNGVIAPTEEGLACFLNDQCLLLFLWHHLPSSCDHPPAQRFNPSQSGRWLRVLMTEFDQGKVHKNADREFLGFFSSGNWKSSYLSNNTGPLSPRTASSPNWDYLYILLQKAYFDESNWWLLHMFSMFSQWHTRTWLQERFHILEGGLFSKVAMWELLVVNMWQSRWCWCIVPPPPLPCFIHLHHRRLKNCTVISHKINRCPEYVFLQCCVRRGYKKRSMIFY